MGSAAAQLPRPLAGARLGRVSYGQLDYAVDFRAGCPSGLTIHRADLRIRIDHSDLRWIERGHYLPFVVIRKTCICSRDLWCGHFQGGTLELGEGSRRMVYVIGALELGAEPGSVWHPAEWPD